MLWKLYCFPSSRSIYITLFLWCSDYTISRPVLLYPADFFSGFGRFSVFTNQSRGASLIDPWSADFALISGKNTDFPAKTNTREGFGPPGKEKWSTEKNPKPSPVGHTVGRPKKQRKNLIFRTILKSIGKAPEVRRFPGCFMARCTKKDILFFRFRGRFLIHKPAVKRMTPGLFHFLT